MGGATRALGGRRSRPWLGGTSARIVAVMLVLLAFAVRIWDVERTSPYTPINDGQSYLTLGAQVANHGDYLTRHTPRSGAGGSIGPTAYFPPAYPYFLAGVDLLDGHTVGGGQAVHDARLATAALGAITVGVLGLVALEAFGPATALVAMLIAALYPPLVELAGTPYSENLLIPLELEAEQRGGALPLQRIDEIKREAIAARLNGGRFGAEYGGQGWSMVEWFVVNEQFGRVTGGLHWHVPNAYNVLLSGTPEQIERYLIPAVRGEGGDAYAVTEAEAGSDPNGIGTTAERTDGG